MNRDDHKRYLMLEHGDPAFVLKGMRRLGNYGFDTELSDGSYCYDFEDGHRCILVYDKKDGKVFGAFNLKSLEFEHIGVYHAGFLGNEYNRYKFYEKVLKEQQISLRVLAAEMMRKAATVYSMLLENSDHKVVKSHSCYTFALTDDVYQMVNYYYSFHHDSVYYKPNKNEMPYLVYHNSKWAK